jgi:prevent-host-death family protein
MKQINLYEAKTQLSSLVDRAAKGESFVIAKSGTPVARLVPLAEPVPEKKKIRFGGMEGKIFIPDDFDWSTPQWLMDAFEGKYEGDPEGLENARRKHEASGAPKGPAKKARTR